MHIYNLRAQTQQSRPNLWLLLVCYIEMGREEFYVMRHTQNASNLLSIIVVLTLPSYLCPRGWGDTEVG